MSKGNVAKFVSLLIAAAFILTGCAMATPGPSPVTGFIYSDTKAPGFVTSNAGNLKHGIGQCTSILGWVATGDCSINGIMKDAGISKIHHVDYKTKSVLGVYAEVTVTVYGE